MARLLDFGDRATGAVCKDDNEFHLVRPGRVASGVVTAIYPYSPKHVTVTTATGEKCVIRRSTK